MSRNKYYKFGYSQALSQTMNYWEADKLFTKEFSEVKRGSSLACDWESGWNDGNQKAYDTSLASEIKAIQTKYGFTKDELQSLKQFFTNDVEKKVDRLDRLI